jgi:hypothetical protein
LAGQFFKKPHFVLKNADFLPFIAFNNYFCDAGVDYVPAVVEGL